MTRNIKIKAGIIVVVILVCIYGIIGLPKSKDELIANWKKNIHLGLDLSGGTQLVMEVQLQDAFKAFADNTIDRMKDEFKKDNIDFSDINRNDPQTLAGCRQDRDRYQRRPGREKQRLPQHRQRYVPGMDTDRVEFQRLSADHEAHRSAEAQAGHHDSDHGDHRAQDQRAGVGRVLRAAHRPQRRRSRPAGADCRASTIRPM